MSRSSWHILKEGDALILARRLPVRFDLRVMTYLERGDKSRLARQIRQDVWRALRTLRGFSPVVRIEPCEGRLCVTAGGQLDAHAPRALATQWIAEVLEDPCNRARWIRWAV